MDKYVFYNISAWLSEYGLFNIIELNNDIVENIYLDKLKLEQDNNETSLSCSVLLGKSFELSLPNINELNLLIGDDAEALGFDLDFVLNPEVLIRLKNIPIKLIIQSSLLKPAKLISPNKYEKDPLLEKLIIDIGNASISVSNNGTIDFNFENEVSIPAAFLGDTGIVMELKNLSIHNLDINNISLTIAEAKIILPDFFIIPADTAISITNSKINNHGFSGNCSVDIPLTYNNNEQKFLAGTSEASIFGIPGGLKHIEVIIENNQPTTFNLEGQLLIPYFNIPVDVVFNIGKDNCVSVSLKGIDGQAVSVTKEALITLYLQSLELNCSEQSLTISGGLEPLLFSNEGMKWPRMDVKNLKIDSHGKFSIDEAWLDLKDIATLDLFGFHVELRKIGIGTEGADKMWVDISGGLKLIEQIPLAVDVEGFRLTWPQAFSFDGDFEALANQIAIQFKGVQFSFGVPGAIKIDGLIRFFKDAQAVGFAGDMILVIPPAGLTAEAGLLVGMNTEPNPYVFFYVYFGLESTAGIPLGQSGLALKGALGLFGINVTPDKSPEQNWYYDWYKRAPAPGAHQTTKWTYQRDSLAVGAGVTITTADGVVKGTKGIIVLALPGPILVINGKALILDGLNPNPNAEPPFTATAIFDGREKIVQFNIEAQAELVKDMVDAYAGIEAFFDFKDITNWHLYLGQDQPEDRRIRANILNVIDADAYLMLDMLDADSPRARMGVSVSVKPHIDDVCIDVPFVDDEDDPCIRFSAHLNLDGDGEVSMQPEQFSGHVGIDAGIDVRVLSFKLEIGAKADLSVEGPSPFSLKADLDLYANLPDPLPDYEGNFHYELSIPGVNLDIKNPLAVVSLFNRFTSESKGTEVISTNDERIQGAKENDYLQSKGADNKPIVPVVECDANPVLAFEHEMNQDYAFLKHPENGIRNYDTGIIRFTPTLRKFDDDSPIISIEEKKKSDPNATWVTIYSTSNSTLKGVWLAESDPASPTTPACRKLQLLTNNPLINTAHDTGQEGLLMMQLFPASSHLSEQILEDYPDLMTLPCEEAKPTCVYFNYTGKDLNQQEIEWAGLELSSGNILNIENGCLTFQHDIHISFPEPVNHTEIKFCQFPQGINIETFARPAGKQLERIIREAKEKKIKPDLGCNIQVKNRIIRNYNGWTIQSDQPFDCLTITKSGKGVSQIQSLCYITVQAESESIANKKTCADNTGLFTGMFMPTLDTVKGKNLFNPGCFYRITISSNITGEVRNIKEDFIRDLYATALGTISRSFKSYAYFQTESPPENIEAYIKWALPARQALGVFVSDPIVIRFKRDYMSALFGNDSLADYKMKIFLRDTEKNIITTDITWKKSQSATKFPDEDTWDKHLTNKHKKGALNSNDINVEPNPDDIIVAKVNDNASAPKYKPSGRYELIIAIKDLEITNNEQAIARNEKVEKENKGKPVIKHIDTFYKILASYNFTTSRFKSMNEAVLPVPANSNQPLNAILISSGTVSSIGNNFPSLLRSWVNTEMNYYKTLIDYDYGMARLEDGRDILVSKEALEKAKLNLRKTKDDIDGCFREFALSINPDIVFKEAGQKTEVFAVISGQEHASKIEYLWLRFPESIVIKNKLDNHASKSFGNIEFSLYRDNQPIKSSVIFNSDTTQVIFKPNHPINFPAAEITLRMNIKNTKDNTDYSRGKIFNNIQNNHHRYDRPAFESTATDEIFDLKMLIKSN